MTLHSFLKDIPLEVAENFIKKSKSISHYITPFSRPLEEARQFCQLTCPRDRDRETCYFDSYLTEAQKEKLKNVENYIRCICTLKVSYSPIINMLEVLKKDIYESL